MWEETRRKKDRRKKRWVCPRGPRFHTISTVFIGKGEGELKAGDDAKEIKVFKKEEIPSTLVFDHKRILKDYFKGNFL